MCFFKKSRALYKALVEFLPKWIKIVQNKQKILQKNENFAKNKGKL